MTFGYAIKHVEHFELTFTSFSALLPRRPAHLVQFLYSKGNRRSDRHYVLGQQFVQLFRWPHRGWCDLRHGRPCWAARLGMALYVDLRLSSKVKR